MRFALALLFSLAACTKPAPDGERAPGAPAPTSPPARVTIGVFKSPPGTLVMEAGTGRVLGTAPGTIEIERSIDPIKLEFVNPDFISEHRVVTPTQDLALSVPMRPVPPHKGPPPPPERR